VITFNDILQSAGVDPGAVRLARHQDSRAPGGSIYGVWRLPHGPSLVERYQSLQKRDVFRVGEFVASFVVTPPPRSETLFIGLYKVCSAGRCAPGTIEPLTRMDAAGFCQYELAYDDRLGEYKDRLSVDWGGGTRSWVQLAARQPKTIRSIREHDDPPFPGKSQFCVDVDEVLGLYASWQDRLREIKGIYLLVDKRTGEQYVGSAKGEDSLWGRFCDYARTGDGGNAELKHRPGARYQVSILQVVDGQLPDHGIEEIESWWKRKLMTREHGLNRN
jgi:hypothetical protein